MLILAPDFLFFELMFIFYRMGLGGGLVALIYQYTELYVVCLCVGLVALIYQWH